jgi:hypothetical protein
MQIHCLREVAKVEICYHYMRTLIISHNREHRVESQDGGIRSEVECLRELILKQHIFLNKFISFIPFKNV